MAYCRFTDADIYLYPCATGVVCCACLLAELVPTVFTRGGELMGKQFSACPTCGGAGCESCMMRGNWEGPTAAEAIDHVRKHLQAGHHVPSHVVAQLEREAKS